MIYKNLKKAEPILKKNPHHLHFPNCSAIGWVIKYKWVAIKNTLISIKTAKK